MMWINGESDPFFVQPAKFTIMCRIMSNTRREEARGGTARGELRGGTAPGGNVPGGRPGTCGMESGKRKIFMKLLNKRGNSDRISRIVS